MVSPRTTPRRSEVWLVDFGEPVGNEQGHRRPAVVVSHDRFNASRAQLAFVVPMTRTRRPVPSHVEVEPGESGLDCVSYAKVEDLKSISTERLIRRFGVVSPLVMARISQATRFILKI